MSTDFEKYVKALPFKEGVQYLLVVEHNAVSMAVLSRLDLPNTAIIRVHGSCDAVRLFEVAPKAPVESLEPEGDQA